MEGVYKKPNQLINIDRTNLSRIFIESIDFMLELAQDEIYKSKTIDNIECDKLLAKIYEIPIEYVLNERGRDSFPMILSHLNQLSDMKIKCMDDKYNFGVSNIFQNCKYNKTNDTYEYMLNNLITMSFYHNTNMIGGEIESKPYYTKLDIYKRGDMKFKNECAFHMYEYCLQYENLLKKVGSLEKVYKLEEFKAMIGLSEYKYPIIADLKNKVINKIIKELHTNNYHIDIQIFGVKGKQKYVRVVFYDKQEALDVEPEIVYPPEEIIPNVEPQQTYIDLSEDMAKM